MPTPLIDLKALKEAADFERILTHYGVALVGKGDQRTALCPLHREAKPSFKVNLKRKIWNCFGCKAHGNVLDFVMLKEGVNEPQAATKIAEICGLSVPMKRNDDRHPVKGPKLTVDARNVPEMSEPSLEDKTRVSAHPGAPGAVSEVEGGLPTGQAGLTGQRPATAAVHARPDQPTPIIDQINPPLSFSLDLDPAHPYLAERGLSPEIIRKFGLGSARRGGIANRICIPIHNERGELVAYAGRWPGEPPNDTERYRLPAKFRKSHVVFNLHRVAGCRHLVVVEGFFSVFRLHALRIPAVALMGTVLSAEQEALLAGFGLRAITLMLDGDAPGRKAAADILPRLAGWCFVRRADLPEGSQPDTIDEAELIRYAR